MENLDEHKIFQNLSLRIYKTIHQFQILANFKGEEYRETDFSSITAQDIIEKINNHLKQCSNDQNTLLFLNYLGQFPVSMCKREVSPLLSLIIGFHYRMSIPTEAQAKEGLEKIGYEDLSQIFGRSKATISDCIKKTEVQWQSFQQQLKHGEVNP